MKKVKVLGEDIVIKYVHLENHGEYDHDKRTIFIKEDHDPNTVEATIFHEMIHAALAISGISEIVGTKVEEGIVRCIEHAIYPIVKGFSEK